MIFHYLRRNKHLIRLEVKTNSYQVLDSLVRLQFYLVNKSQYFWSFFNFAFSFTTAFSIIYNDSATALQMSGLKGTHHAKFSLKDRQWE